MSIEQKWELRKEELEKKGIVGKELSDQVGLEQKSGKLDELYPDPALSHIGGIDWNKNNNKLVFVANDGKGKNGIAVSDPEFREVKWIKKVKDMDIYYTSFSHTGDEITYLMNGDIYIIDVTTSDEKQITKGIIIGMPSFMPDDQNLLTGKGIIDFNGIFVEKFKQGLGDPAISPNGEWVAYAGRRTGFEMINLKTGEKKEILKTGDFPKWSPDGQWVLTGWEGEIVKDNPYSGEKISLRPRK